jgi:phage gp45-like
MTMTGSRTQDLLVLVEGAPLDPTVRELLESAEIESNLFLPDQFQLVFKGGRTKVLMAGGFQLAVAITLSIDAGDGPIPLLIGEVTGVEIDWGPNGNRTIVSGFDRSHRMMSGTSSKSWVDMPASDIVSAILATWEIAPGKIEPTDQIYPVLVQPNVSDWEFIQHLAALEGRDAYSSMETFNFSIPTVLAGDPPPAIDPTVPPTPRQLAFGVNLVRLHAVVTSGQQVDSVIVRGWNPLAADPVMMPTEVLNSKSSDIADPKTLPSVVAGEFSATTLTSTTWPIESEGAAGTLGQSIATKIAGSLAELEGECFGDPEILAGSTVSLGMAGDPFDGNYVVSSARHRYVPGVSGYTTWFSVGGRSDRSTLALASGGQGGVSNLVVPGVVIGTVTSNTDPEEIGRVKVMYPWLDDTVVSDWIRPVQLGAGEGYGFLVVPEVGSEVLLAFDHGDFQHPYIIGNLYNGVVRPEPSPEIDGTVNERRIVSRTLHTLKFSDDPEDLGVKLVTGDQTCTLNLDATQTTITIQSTGVVQIKGATSISIESEGDLSLSATGDLSIQGEGSVSIQSPASVSVSSDGSTTVSGEGGLELSSAASVEVSGAMIALGG